MPPTNYVVYKAPVTLGLTEVISILSERTGIRRDDIKLVLDELFYLIFEALRRGHNIKIPNVGCFNVTQTYARVAWGQDGKLRYVPSIHQTSFRVARSIKQRMLDFFAKGLVPPPPDQYIDEITPFHLKYALRVAERRLERRMLVNDDDLALLRSIINKLKEKEEYKTAPSEDEAGLPEEDDENEEDSSEESEDDEDYEDDEG